MPCELTDGVSLLVEMFYQPSQDVRRYGGDNYGDGFYGNSNTGEPEPPYWVDVTRFCTYVSVQRGDLQPRIGQNTDQISIELMDNYGDVYGWQGNIAFSSPQFNTPVRVCRQCFVAIIAENPTMASTMVSTNGGSGFTSVSASQVLADGQNGCSESNINHFVFPNGHGMMNGNANLATPTCRGGMANGGMTNGQPDRSVTVTSS